MWSRAIIKSNAKAAISGKKYWIAFLLVAVLILVPVVLEKVSGYEKINNDLANAITYGTAMPDSSLVLGYNLGFFLLSLLVITPLMVGLCGFFVRNRFDAGKPSDLFLAFRGGYGNVILVSFVTSLFIGLWSLLLIVPGIIKGVQYSMVPFLLSDYPGLSGKRAREISRKMTDGEKSSIFVLILSFIGWFLLPALVAILITFFALTTPGLDIISQIIVQAGTIMVMVYFYATFAELYIFLRDRAIQTGMVQPEELGL
jgi:uncharacterized membrane protein